MKISVYQKKCSATTSNICFRVREKNVDIKVVSPIAVHDKYWDADTLCYRRTTAVTAIEQKRVPEQIAAMAELLAELPKPVLMFCRSGSRSANLYAQSCLLG